MFSNVRKSFVVVAAGALVALGLMAHPTLASYVTTDTRLPSPSYHSTNAVTYGGQYQVDSFFDVFTDLVRVPGPPPGGAQVDSFFDVFTELSIEPLGTASMVRESPTLQSIRTTRRNGLPPGTSVFDTEMLQLDLAGGSAGSTLPPGVMLRESPTLQSTGQTSITDIGGGQFKIDSFFDVFTELSVDGGQTWTPSNAPLHLVGGVPEPSTLMLAGLSLVAYTAMSIRRARRGR